MYNMGEKGGKFMFLYQTDIDNLRKKFYERRNTFQKFNGIKRENIAKINQDVERLTTMWSKRPIPTTNYVEALKVITIQNCSLANFDEKIIFLIKCVDPSLKALKIYLKYNIKSKAEIEKIAQGNSFLRQDLLTERSKTLQQYEKELFEELGISDLYLAHYEQYYERLFVRTKPAEKEKPIQKDYSNEFFKGTQNIENFPVSKERLAELKAKASAFKALLPDTYQQTTTIYKLLHASNNFQLKSKEEAYIFFILVCDENLTALRIFEEESTWAQIKKRTLEELSFYYKELPKLEKLYYYQFTPELELSPWLAKKNSK